MFMFFFSHIVQYGITAKTGFPTRVEELKSNPLTGSLSARDFEIRNPDHFEHGDFLEIAGLQVKVVPSSLFRDRIVVERVEVEIPRLTGVRNAEGTINFGEFRSAVEGLMDEHKEGGDGKAVVIESFSLKIDKVFLIDYSGSIPETTQEYDVDIDIRLSDVVSLRAVAPEVFRRFAAAGISFEADSIFTALVPERYIDRVRSDITGDGEGEPRETPRPLP